MQISLACFPKPGTGVVPVVRHSVFFHFPRGFCVVPLGMIFGELKLLAMARKTAVHCVMARGSKTRWPGSIGNS